VGNAKRIGVSTETSSIKREEITTFKGDRGEGTGGMKGRKRKKKRHLIKEKMRHGKRQHLRLEGVGGDGHVEQIQFPSENVPGKGLRRGNGKLASKASKMTNIGQMLREIVDETGAKEGSDGHPAAKRREKCGDWKQTRVTHDDVWRKKAHAMKGGTKKQKREGEGGVICVGEWT